VLNIKGVYFSQKTRDQQLEKEVVSLLEASGLSFSNFVKYLLDDKDLIINNKKSKLYRLLN
jgi:G:T-mismatch repair DNA endonuclease (very short patch repair protein)